jgi:hypothetical protein
MSQTLVEKAGERLIDSVRDASRMTSAAAEAAMEGVAAAKHAVRESCDTADAFVNDSKRRVAQNPLVAVTVSLVTGVALGLLVGSTMRRR